MPSLETLYETRWLRLDRIGHWDFVRRPHSDSCVGILAITHFGSMSLRNRPTVTVIM